VCYCLSEREGHTNRKRRRLGLCTHHLLVATGLDPTDQTKALVRGHATDTTVLGDLQLLHGGLALLGADAVDALDHITDTKTLVVLVPRMAGNDVLDGELAGANVILDASAGSTSGVGLLEVGETLLVCEGHQLVDAAGLGHGLGGSLDRDGSSGFGLADTALLGDGPLGGGGFLGNDSLLGRGLGSGSFFGGHC
jgi:hypothetical protein